MWRSHNRRSKPRRGRLRLKEPIRGGNEKRLWPREKTRRSKSSRSGERDKCICWITGGMTNLRLRDSSEVAHKPVLAARSTEGNKLGRGRRADEEEVFPTAHWWWSEAAIKSFLNTLSVTLLTICLHCAFPQQSRFVCSVNTDEELRTHVRQRPCAQSPGVSLRYLLKCW